MMRYEIIQRLIDHYGYKSYLEIGLGNGNTWNRVKSWLKLGIEPEPKIETPELSSLALAVIKHRQSKARKSKIFGTYYLTGVLRMTSDEYFEWERKQRRLNNSEPIVLFDLIFIDGLHLADQVERDIVNSLAHLNEGGTIVLHDCNPPSLEYAEPEVKVFKPVKGTDDVYPVWCGTVWQAVAGLGSNSGLDFFTVDTDWGVGILRVAEQWKYHPYGYPMSWRYFDANRKELLNLITVDEFNERYPAK